MVLEDSILISSNFYDYGKNYEAVKMAEISLSFIVFAYTVILSEIIKISSINIIFISWTIIKIKRMVLINMTTWYLYQCYENVNMI